jgi:hypothetical protein
MPSCFIINCKNRNEKDLPYTESRKFFSVVLSVDLLIYLHTIDLFTMTVVVGAIIKIIFLNAHTGCITKNLWCCNFLIFHTILINDVSNKIVLNGLQFELIQYLFLSSVFD